MFTFTPKELFSKLLKNFFGQLFPPSLFFLSLSLFHLTHSLSFFLSFFLCLSDTSTNVKLTTNIFSLVLALARSLTLNTFAIVDSLSLHLTSNFVRFFWNNFSYQQEQKSASLTNISCYITYLVRLEYFLHLGTYYLASLIVSGQSCKPSVIGFYNSRVVLTGNCLMCDSSLINYDKIAF